MNLQRKIRKRFPSRLDRRLASWVWRTADDAVFAQRFSRANRRWRLPIDVEYDTAQRLFLVHADGDTLVVARRSRLGFFADGLQRRQARLVDEYLLDRVPFVPGDVVVDVGANIGEVSRLLAMRHGVETVAIEPDRREFPALERNLHGFPAELHNAILWSEESEVDFFDANDSGDSSVFPAREGLVSERRVATTLDLLLAASAHSSGPIRLLKLEAEGAEPEIIRGATHTLERTEFVSADLGPERGIKAESTLIPVYEMLSERGFTAAAIQSDRLVMLFQRP